MIQAIKNNLVTFVAGMALLFVAVLLPANVSAADATVDINGNVNCGANNISLGTNGTGCDDSTTASSTIENTIKTIINVFSAIVGSISVIMIIIGGFRYITSAGDSNNVGGAKNTILYAIVGLIIVAIAQVIVQFVLERAV